MAHCQNDNLPFLESSVAAGYLAITALESIVVSFYSESD